MTRRLALASLALLLALVAPAARAQAPLTVFAAASLSDAFNEIGQAWAAQGHRPVRFSFAASSTLAKQIEQGAPVAIFASADARWMDYLAERKLVDASTRSVLATNRLVMVVPADQASRVELRAGVDYARLYPGQRIATGDPAHVPVGRYAEQALKAIGAWNALAPRLVRVESVRAALAYVERGEVAAGIVYATDAAISTRVRIAGAFPDDSHDAIVYPVARVAGRDDAEASAFLAFLRSAAARTILRRYGFGDP